MKGMHGTARDRYAPGGEGEGGKVADTEIARLLAVALAIGADPRLRETLRGLAGAAADTPFAVGQPGGNAWLTVDGGRVAASRRRPEDIALVGQDALRAHANTVARDLRAALARTTALSQAARLVAPLLEPGEAPSRRDFDAVHSWAPAIEQIAYKTVASLAMTLDLLRPHLVPALHAGARLRPGLLTTYWQRMHAMAQCALYASDREARPWLAELAHQFDWMNWTPTFFLLRERTTWLAACAARSAVAFGEAVVENYLATLRRATHPFKVFDALFGLAAIALGNAGLAPGIAAEVRSCRRHSDIGGEAGAYVLHIYRDALQIIEGTADWAGDDAAEVEALGWRARSRVGLATDLAFRTDPATITQSGHLLGFITLPIVVDTPVDRFNPDRSPREDQAVPMSEEIIGEIVRGAWAPSPRADRVIH